MAAPVFAIATLNNPITGDENTRYYFQDLLGNIDIPEQKVDVFERKGVNSHGLILTGVRGDPFQLVSIQYVTDMATAYTTLTTFQSLIATANVVKIIQNDNQHWPADVLSVKYAEPPRRVGKVVSSIVSGVTVRLACVWTLKARVPTPP